MDYRSLYKIGAVRKNTVEDKKVALSVYRQAKRLQTFNRHRDYDVNNFANEEGQNELGKKFARKDLLQEWKTKKMQLKKANESKKKPFVVGITRHNVGSPLFRDISNNPQPKLKSAAKLVIADDATVKQFPFQPAASNQQFKFSIKPSAKKLTVPQSPSFMSAKKQKLNVHDVENVKINNNVPQKKKVIPKGKSGVQKKVVKTPEPNPRIQSTKGAVKKITHTPRLTRCRVKLLTDQNAKANSESGKEGCGASVLPITSTDVSGEQPKFVISPFVSVTRGKSRHCAIRPTDSAKKDSGKEKISLRDASHDEAKDTSESAPFYSRLDNEARNLIGKCDFWSNIRTHNVPKDHVDEIDSVVGQSRLLVKDKFEQFRSLILRFDNKSVPPVTVDDLNGFWDMMYIQVEKLEERMRKLEILKNNNWVESRNESTVQNPKKKIVKKPKTKCAGNANFRKFLKEMKSQTTGQPTEEKEGDIGNVSESSASCEPSGSTRKSLLKKVLSASITERRRSSINAGMCALMSSFTGKELGSSPFQLVDEVVPSPNASILKNGSLVNKNDKSAKKVTFNEYNDNDTLNTTFTIDENTDGHSSQSTQDNSFSLTPNSNATHGVVLPEPVSGSDSDKPLISFLTPKRKTKRRPATPGLPASVTPRRSLRILSQSTPGSDRIPRRSQRMKN